MSECLRCQQPIEPGQQYVPVETALSEREYNAGWQAVTHGVHLDCLKDL